MDSELAIANLEERVNKLEHELRRRHLGFVSYYLNYFNFRLYKLSEDDFQSFVNEKISSIESRIPQNDEPLQVSFQEEEKIIRARKGHSPLVPLPLNEMELAATNADVRELLNSRLEEQRRRVLRMVVRLEAKFNPPFNHQIPENHQAGEVIYFATNRAEEILGNKRMFQQRRGAALTYGTCRTTQRSNAPDRRYVEWIVNGPDAPPPVADPVRMRVFIVFVHGYNQSFGQAIACAFKLRERLALNHPNKEYMFAVFSWPSFGDSVYLGFGNPLVHVPLLGNVPLGPLGHMLRTIGQPWFYALDAASCEGCESYLPVYVNHLISVEEAAEVHFIGHSMGCRLLLRALTDLQNPQHGEVIKSVTFASPDVDQQMFTTLLPTLPLAYPALADCRFLVFRSEGDIALNFSGWLHGYHRAGQTSGARPYFPLTPTYDEVDDSSLLMRRLTLGYYDDQLSSATGHFDFLYSDDCVLRIRQLL